MPTGNGRSGIQSGTAQTVSDVQSFTQASSK